MSSTLQFINEQDPSSCRRSVIIQDLPLDTKPNDLYCAMKKHLSEGTFRIEFGNHYNKGSEQRQRAYVNCDLQQSVNQLMKARPIFLHGDELIISRFVPKTETYHGHITSSLVVQLSADVPYGQTEVQRVKEGLEKHFRQFGTVRAREWIIVDQLLFFAFDDYDIVDQIILAPHPSKIQQFRVQLSKTLRVPQDLSPSVRCTHLTNLPADVTSRELATIYGVHPADTLLKPVNPLYYHIKSPDPSSSAEAWIKGTSHPPKMLRGVSISSQIVKEPMQSVQFCRDFREGKCQWLAGECFYQHTLCSQPTSCESVKCVYGHYFSMARESVKGPGKLFRLKLTTHSTSISKTELEKVFPKIDPSFLILPPNLSETNVSYIVNQTSANFLRKLMHRRPQFECQLETNESFFDWDRPVDLPPSVKKASVHPTPVAPWFKPANSDQ